MTSPQMVDFDVTPQMVLTASTDTHNTADLVEQELLALRRYVVTLLEEWLGVAAHEFDEAMARYDVNAQSLNIALRGISSGLMSNYVHYRDNEAGVAGTIRDIGYSIPPANL